MRRTKIVATLGPSSTDPVVIEKLIQNGMNVARLNFSHGTHSDHRKRLDSVRGIAQRLGQSVAVLQDLSGPKIRIRELADPNGVNLAPGATFTLTSLRVEGSSECVSTTYPELSRDLQPGNRILLDDGLIELTVDEVRGTDVRTRVVTGGVLKPHKGINLPGATISAPSLTAKDREDLDFGLTLDVDYVALSFVRTGDDVRQLKNLLAERGRGDIPVIAKIEKPEAIDNLSDILEEAAGVMVARGDLGVEVPAERVPTLQKHIIRQAVVRGRLVITATQMLESMVENPRPTRAEASDVANAILDGTDAVMLSAETASGIYPVESVAMMSRIALYTEGHQEKDPLQQQTADSSFQDRSSVSRAVAIAACRAAAELNASHIVVFTESGVTARLVSHFRPRPFILGMTPSERVFRRMALAWGVTPVLAQHYSTMAEMLNEGLSRLKSQGLVAQGDLVVLLFGTTPLPGATDVMKVHRL